MPRYSVESGIKRPPQVRRGRPARYPFAKMAKGDSFAFARPKMKRVLAAAQKYGDKNGARFSVRSNGTKARIWRVK